MLSKSQGLGWTPLRKALSGVFPDVSLKSYASFATFGRAKAKGAILVPLLHPIEAVALQIAKTKTPEKALAAWMAEISDLLAEQRKKRTRVMLVPAGVFAEDGAALIAILSKKLKAHPTEDAALDVSVKPEIPVLDLIAAQYLLESSEAAGKLLERLHDVAVCPFASSVVDANDILKLRDEAGAPQPEAIEEAGFLRESLAGIVAEHTDIVSETAQLRAELKTASERLAEESGALAKVTADLEARNGERDLLRESLAGIISDYSALQAQAVAQDVELDNLRGQLREQYLLKATNAALEQRIQSAEQKMTARSAILGKVFLIEGQRREDLAAEKQKEIAVAQVQLTDLSQELEAQSALLERAQEALLSTEKDAATKAEELGQELEALKAQLFEGDAMLKQLSDELNHIYTSKSWKITEPMRQTRARFQGRKS
ncbi:hypothetical protein [Phaeobacter italicus]|uniref:hypothetical protein n=1 Tax=Phaeobacter italicus TaxID=481446 RepID=UPI00248D8845|nr:hypothetical protein [Phaeobacter italicus]